MAGVIEELFSILKIVPDENNLQNVSEHLNGFDKLIQNFTGNLKELVMQHLVDDTGSASENLKKAGINVEAIKRNLPNVEKNVGKAEENAGKFKTEMKGAEENIDEALKKSQLMTNHLHALNIVGGFLTNIIKGWVNEMKNFASESLKAGSEFQKMKISMQAVFGDEKMADNFIEQLDKMEKKSKFSKEQLGGVAQQLLPTFEDPEQVLGMVGDIQRIAAVGEKGGASLDGMANALIQISNAAEISKKDLKMLGSASGGTLNLFAQLQKDLGKSKDEIDKMLKKGLVSKNQIAKAMQNASAGFGDLPEQLGNTYDVAFARIKGNIQENLGKALLPLANAFKPLMEELEKVDFSNVAKKVEIFANAIVAATPMILNIAGALFKFADILMTIAAPFAQLIGWVLNFIATTPGLNAAFIGLLGLLGMKGLTFVLQLLILKVREMATTFAALSSAAVSAGTAAGTAGTQIASAGTAASVAASKIASAGTAAQVAKGQIANAGIAASTAGTQIAGASRAMIAFNAQAAAAPTAMMGMVRGLGKVALGVRALGRTVKATLAGIGPVGWAMLGIGAAAEIYNHFQSKKEEKDVKSEFDALGDLDIQKPKDQKPQPWLIDQKNDITNNFQLDREGKSNMSKEMLDTAIKEQTRSIFNMEIMRVLEMSEQAGAVSV
jgi:tape measure domain-containing protein